MRWDTAGIDWLMPAGTTPELSPKNEKLPSLAAFDSPFASAELLWRTLTRKRWELLRAMTGQDAMSIREAAQRVGRDVKAVHGDVQTLLNAGVIDRTAEGIVFPYDAVHIDFMLTKAA